MSSFKSNLFYETQLNNPKITWRLYAHKTAGSSGELIDVGILQDPEMNFTISHDFNEGIEDPIGGKLKEFHGAAKSIAPYFNSTGSLLNNIKTALGDGIAADLVGSLASAATAGGRKVNETFADLAGLKNPKGNRDVDKAMNASFVSAFDRVKTFTGSNVSFNIPKLETTWISGLLSNLFGVDTITERILNVVDFVLGETKDILEIYGLQLAPISYEPKFTGLNDDPQFNGTYSLIIGDKTKIRNLVLKQFQYNPSTIKCMDTDDDPLYATVSYDLEPAAYITNHQLKKILKGTVGA